MKIGIDGWGLGEGSGIGKGGWEKGERNKAGYATTEVACGWAEAIFEVTRPFGQEQ